MAYEIVSTSSPRNLDGQSGFGTVIKTERCPVALDIAINGLSGYTHLFSAGNPQNPVCWNYLQVKADSKLYYVLSRIADSGADHTLRSNRLAAHLILQTSETASCSAGPTALMLRGDICNSYSGTAHLVPDRVLNPCPSTPAKICQAWRQITGDAGWGGFLAEATKGNKPVYIIYNPGTDLLSLFAESMSLLPPSYRWKVTFSTYYSSQIERYNCLWRGVVAGTPMAMSISQSDCTIIDLSKPLPVLNSSSPLVSTARTGMVNKPELNKPEPTPTINSRPMERPVSNAPIGTYNIASDATRMNTISPPMSQPMQPNWDSPTHRPFSKNKPERQLSHLGLWISLALLFIVTVAMAGYMIISTMFIQKQLEELKQATESIQEELEQSKTDFSDSMDQKFDKIKEELEKQKREKRLEDIRKSLSTGTGNVNDTLTVQMETLKNQVDELQQNTLPTLTKRVDNTEKKATDNETNLTGLSTQNGNLQKQLNTLKKEFDAVFLTDTIKITGKFNPDDKKQNCKFVTEDNKEVDLLIENWTNTNGEFTAVIKQKDGSNVGSITYKDKTFTLTVKDMTWRKSIQNWKFALSPSVSLKFFREKTEIDPFR